MRSLSLSLRPIDATNGKKGVCPHVFFSVPWHAFNSVAESDTVRTFNASRFLARGRSDECSPLNAFDFHPSSLRDLVGIGRRLGAISTRRLAPRFVACPTARSTRILLVKRAMVY